ncbi:MAG: hypothetical protein V7704_05865 [Aurantimonas endophytica]|uniref:hypothetical protein n=1 Tax=Aurantimonas endophytica TaxID=1522175 RepID=UPI003001BF11
MARIRSVVRSRRRDGDPTAFVWGEKTAIALKSQSAGLQRRTFRIKVSFEDRIDWAADFAAAATDLAVRIEAAVMTIGDVVPVESVTLVEDDGIAVLDGSGVDGTAETLVSSGVGFDVVFYTTAGEADWFVVGNW